MIALAYEISESTLLSDQYDVTTSMKERPRSVGSETPNFRRARYLLGLYYPSYIFNHDTQERSHEAM